MARTLVKRAFKFRFYPTEGQAAELSRTFGCVRKVYNLALDARTRAWSTEQRRVNYGETSAMLTEWKKSDELASLSEVSSVPLQQCLQHLQGAFTAFFGKRARYPRFKSRKRSRASAEYTRSAFRYRDGRLTLAKMPEPLDIVWSRALPEGAEPSTVTVSRDSAGRGRNREKARRKVARVHARITDRRKDHLHKVTTRLVRENQTIVIEDLNVRGMMKNRGLARAIADVSWTQFRQFLEYKAAWYGREVIAVDRWFPSSTTCSTCGAMRDRMPMEVREWMCACGVTHDRDVNAAKNIVAAGLAVSACGDGVRPT